jgi:hypothetical protein
MVTDVLVANFCHFEILKELHSDHCWQAMTPAGSVMVPGNLQNTNNPSAPTAVQHG